MSLRVFRTAAAAGLALTLAAVVAAVAASGEDLPTRAGTGGPPRPAAIALADPRAVADAGAEAPAPPDQRRSGSSQDFMINGDRVLAADATDGADGALAAAVLPAASRGLAGSVITLGLDGRTYQVPAAAVPYLGRGLDLSLFDPATLLTRETGGRLPVSLDFSGSTPALPGVVITSSGHGTAQGYLTASSARTFGAALDRQYAADHARDSYGTDGLFAGGVSIALAGTASPGRLAPAPRSASTAQAASPGGAQPDYPMHTLTMNATDTSGQPDTGDYVLLFNVDNSGLLNVLQEDSTFYKGTTKVSVPAGHYCAVGVFLNAQGSTYAVVLPQFTVTGNTTVSIAATSATSEISMATPRPATAQSTGFYVVRTAAKGPLDDVGFLATNPIWVNPEHRKPTVGTLRAYADQVLASVAGQSGTPYSYELSYTDPAGIIPAQHYQVRQAVLATVHENFFQASPSSGTWIMLGSFPTTSQLAAFVGFVNPASIPLSLPGRLTVYVGGTGSAPMVWASDYRSSNGDYQASETGRQFRTGTQVTDNWGAYPLHPAPNAMLYLPRNVLGLTPVSAARNGDTLWLDVTPFSDNQPGHLGVGFSPVSKLTATGSYQIAENGTVVATGNAVTAAERGAGDVPVQATLSAKPGTVQFELTAALAGPAFGLSDATQTVWTWRSAPVTSAKLPGDWICAANPLDPSLSPDCAVQPMMTLAYGVARLGLDGTAPAGRQVLDLTAGHIQPARNTGITEAHVWVSLDGGQTWRAARVTRTGARTFRAVFSAPAGSQVTLRTKATDAAGGSITEVITRAYEIAAAVRVASTGAAGPSAATPSVMRAACQPVPRGHVRCFALFARQDAVNAAIARGASAAATTPAGWGATDIESAYKLPVTRDPGQTVAVVEAYSTPHLAADLAVYRKQYGLPACGTGSGCLRIVNQAGLASPLPASGVPYGWDVETMLDVSMVSAACPHCKILIVQARSNAIGNMAAAEDTAARLGAQVISNSYGTQESGLTQAYAQAYRHPGHVIVVSTGDLGFTTANFPANLATVTAVGGTELARANNKRGWSERVWDIGTAGASGSGCSAYVAKPSWQHDPDCGMRTVADVSALAWNIPVYDQSQGGWLTVGGTSAAAPLVAGVYGLAGNAATLEPGYEYAHAKSLFDITKGNNDLINGTHGATCGFDYLCVAGAGYDAPTGLGTPHGIGAF